MQKTRWYIQSVIKSLGLDVRRMPKGELSELDMFVAQSADAGASLIVDVGANTGQFAKKLLWNAPNMQVLSVEPQRASHVILSEQAANDPRWFVAERCAIGRAAGTASINLSANSYSSSLYAITDIHLEAAGDSHTSGSEDVPIKTLPAILDDMPESTGRMIGLKIDTQGYELEVLEGSVQVLDRIPVILSELSLAPLYEGAPSFREMLNWFDANGYRLVGIFPEFYHSGQPEMLQVNGIFVKKTSL